MNKKERTLDEEIELYKKLNQTIYMIVSIIRAQERSDYITIELISKQLLANYEELSFVPHHSSIDELLRLKQNCMNYLLERCNGDSEKRSEIVYANNLEHLIRQDELDEKFSLIMMNRRDYYVWWRTVLDSNLNLNVRSSMYIYILMTAYEPEFFIEYIEKKKKNINDEIFGYINKTADLKNEIFETLVNRSPWLIEFLQKRGLVNFSYATVDGQTALSLMLGQARDYFETFKTLYDGLSQEDKKTSISWIIASSYRDMYTLSKILKLDFKLTKNIIDDLTKFVVSDIDSIERGYGIERYRNDAADSLIRKASNKKEYKEYKRYVEEFLDKTQKILEEREQEKEKDRQAKLLLMNKREEFSTLLYNLNEKLQEEVPGRRKIKEVDFKNLS